jgi:hypothetical protein
VFSCYMYYCMTFFKHVNKPKDTVSQRMFWQSWPMSRGHDHLTNLGSWFFTLYLLCLIPGTRSHSLWSYSHSPKMGP